MARVPVQERREQLITAAVSVIAEAGVEGASTRRIAEAAKSSLASVHYCFANKETLLLDVFGRLLASHRADTAEIVGAGRNVSDVAVDLLGQTLEWGIRNPEQARAELELALWASRQETDLGVKMYAMFSDLWTAILREATPSLPVDDLTGTVRLLMALADGLGLQMLAAQDDGQTRRDTAAANEMLAAHLRARFGTS